MDNILPLYNECTELHYNFYRGEDDVGMNNVPIEENMAYSSHSIENILPDSNSMTKMCLEANLAYTSHSMKQTVGESLEVKVYEQVDLTPCNQ